MGRVYRLAVQPTGGSLYKMLACAVLELHTNFFAPPL